MKSFAIVLAWSTFLAGLAIQSLAAAPPQRPGVQPRDADLVRQWGLAQGWVETVLPPTTQPADIDQAAAAKGFVVFAPDRNNIGPHTQIPSKTDLARPFAAMAFPGEFEGVPVSIHAVSDLAKVSVAVSDLVSPTGAKISYADIDVRDVIYAPFSMRNRQESVNKFRLWPLWLVEHKPGPLKADDGRVVWLTIRCPKDAPAGEYKGTITVRVEPGEVVETRPIALNVQPFALDGEMCSWAPVTSGNGFDLELYRQLAEHHMTGLSWWWGNYGLTVTREGEGANAKAGFDPAPMDLLNAVTREAGMRGPWILMFGNQVSGHLERRIAGMYADHTVVPPLFDVKMIPCPPDASRRNRPAATQPAAPAAGRPATTRPAPYVRPAGESPAVSPLDDKEMDRRYVEVLQALAKRAKEKGYPQIIVMPYDEPTRRLAKWNARYCELIHKFVPELKILNNPQGSLSSAELWMPHSDYMEVEGGDEVDIYQAALKAGKEPFGYTRLWSNITFGQARFDLGLRFAVQQPKIIYFWSLNFGDTDQATPFNDLFEGDSGFRHRFAWPPVKPGQKWVETVVFEGQREGAKDYLLTLMVQRELNKAKTPAAEAIRGQFEKFKAEAATKSGNLEQRRAQLVQWYRQLIGK